MAGYVIDFMLMSRHAGAAHLARLATARAQRGHAHNLAELGRSSNTFRDARRVSARPRQTCNEAMLDRITAASENDRDRCGCRLGRKYWTWSAGRDDDRYLTIDRRPSDTIATLRPST